MKERIPFDKLTVGKKYYLSHTTVDKSLFVVKAKTGAFAVIDWINIWHTQSELSFSRRTERVRPHDWRTGMRFYNPWVWQRKYYKMIFDLLFKTKR